MNEKKKNYPIDVKVLADKLVISAGKPGARIVEVSLVAPPAPDAKPHIPLNLSLVLDRSGSMHGEKLHYVKEAAAHVIDLMSEEDRLTVVLYDDKVHTLMNSQYLTDKVKTEIKLKLKGVESGASTFLYGGWLTGCRQVAESVTKETFNRTLLLTDGLANVGVRDVGALSIHAQELFTRGISTSCFGVGEDYDEHLLESMANNGGGSFHFLETLNAIPLVFEREFDEIISVTIKDVKIQLTLPTLVEVSVSANWHTEREGDQFTIFLGSLMADQKQAIYLQLTDLQGEAGDELEIPVVLTCKDQDQVEHEIKTSITFMVKAETEASAIPQEPELMKRFAVVDLADKANEALKLERAGDRAGSSQYVKNSLRIHQSNISDSTYEKYDHLSSEMSIGMDAVERKRRHYREYQSKRGFQSVRDYHLNFKKGILTAEIEGQSVLINTASHTSIGTISEWPFLDELFKLPDNVDGVTCEEISDALEIRADVMLGMDILRHLYVQTDPDRGVITFSRQHLRSRGSRLDIHEKDGLITCRIPVAGKDLEMRLMTASRLSYVPEVIASGCLPLEEVIETLVGFDKFTTPLYHLKALIGRGEVTLECGVLPEDIQNQMGLGAPEGILGASFFRMMPSTLAFPDDELVILI